MNTVSELREQRAALVTKLRGLLDKAGTESRDLSEAEEADYSAGEANIDQLTARIERAEKLEAMEAGLDESLGSLAARHPGANAPGAKREFESLGEFMHAVRFAPNDARLSYGENPAMRSEHRMDDGASGGFAVPTQFRSEILQVDALSAVVRPRARVMPAGSPPDAELTMPALDQSPSQNIHGGVAVSWIGEGGAKPETNAKLREIKLKPYEVAGHIVVTDKLLRNWAASSAFLSGLLRGAITSSEDTAFLQGNGVAKPLGVINAAGTVAVTRAGAGDIAYEDVLAMDESLLAGAIGAVWLVTKRAKTKLRQMEDTEGHLIWQESARSGEPASLLGYPVVVSDRIPTLGSRGDIGLYDFSNYLIKDGSGPFVSSSEHVHFTDNKTVIKVFWNVDGQPWLNGPITRENGDEQSPFVVLAA